MVVVVLRSRKKGCRLRDAFVFVLLVVVGCGVDDGKDLAGNLATTDGRLDLTRLNLNCHVARVGGR